MTDRARSFGAGDRLAMDPVRPPLLRALRIVAPTDPVSHSGEMATMEQRCLVVFNQPVSEAALEEVATHVPEASGICVLVPATPPRRGLTYTEELADALARYSLDRALAWFHERGFDADGAVGDPSPVEATRDAVRDARFEEIILVASAAGPSRWFGMDLPSRLRRAGVEFTCLVTSDQRAPILPRVAPFLPTSSSPGRATAEATRREAPTDRVVGSRPTWMRPSSNSRRTNRPQLVRLMVIAPPPQEVVDLIPDEYNEPRTPPGSGLPTDHGRTNRRGTFSCRDDGLTFH